MIGYETTFITRADVTDEAQKTMMEKIKTIITAHEGTIVLVEDWGRRKLAYPIEKETRGHYMYVVYTGNNSLVAEIERNLRINETIMRFITIKLGDDFEATTFKKHTTPISAPPPVVEEYR